MNADESKRNLPFTVEFIDPESHEVREVFARFGLAVYEGNCLERELAIALASVYSSLPKKLTREGVRKLLDSNYKKTFGQLVRRLRKSVRVCGSLEGELCKAVEKRNWLAHDYFWERAATFCKQTGRRAMIAELEDLADFFHNVDVELSKITEEWLEKHGVTEETLEKIRKELLEGT